MVPNLPSGPTLLSKLLLLEGQCGSAIVVAFRWLTRINARSTAQQQEEPVLFASIYSPFESPDIKEGLQIP